MHETDLVVFAEGVEDVNDSVIESIHHLGVVRIGFIHSELLPVHATLEGEDAADSVGDTHGV